MDIKGQCLNFTDKFDLLNSATGDKINNSLFLTLIPHVHRQTEQHKLTTNLILV